VRKEGDVHDELEGFFVHGELDGDVWEVVVDLGFGSGLMAE
jgi:hypothetical protein